VENATSPAPITERERLLQNRWLILLCSIISMIAVANLQYGWTLFVTPLSDRLGADRALIQVAFTVFVLLETWLVPFEGYLVDQFGPRNLVLVGGVLAGIGWVCSGLADSLTALYLAYAVAGLGAGIVYGTAVGSALKWFPDHRGLAAGLTAAGFGAGAALTVAPIADLIKSDGYQTAFIQWGIFQGAVVVVAALFLKAPPAGWLPHGWSGVQQAALIARRQSAHDFTPAEMAATSHFWLMYFMMAMVATGGLMATAQLAPMATDYGVDKTLVTFLWITLPALTFALQADRIVNGFCRPFWGWISDHIGREKTMAIAFSLEAIAILCLINFARDPLLFVVFTAFTFFGWGEIYSLMPAMCGDFFGRKYATTNYGFLYTAKGTASLFVPVGSALAAGTAFDFRADILLVLGAILLVVVMLLAPRFGWHPSPTVRGIIGALGTALVTYGVLLTVVPTLWTPFVATIPVPHVGWTGVFAVAVVMDLGAAFLAFFVLRRMQLPGAGERAPAAAAPRTTPIIAGAAE
jgi:OFA family oxalate/formate antiporter-like MFS transporter